MQVDDLVVSLGVYPKTCSALLVQDGRLTNYGWPAKIEAAGRTTKELKAEGCYVLEKYKLLLDREQDAASVLTHFHTHDI